MHIHWNECQAFPSLWKHKKHVISSLLPKILGKDAINMVGFFHLFWYCHQLLSMKNIITMYHNFYGWSIYTYFSRTIVYYKLMPTVLILNTGLQSSVLQQIYLSPTFLVMEVAHNTVVNYNSDHDFADYIIIFSLIKVRTKYQSDKNKLPRYQYNHAFVKLHDHVLLLK